MKKFKVNPSSKKLIKAARDMGLTSQDDPLLYGWMYEYTKHYDDLPDYDTVLDEWDESVSPKAWATAFNRLRDALESVEYYNELYRERYIELSDNHTLTAFDVSEDVAEQIGEEGLEEIYVMAVEDAKEEFYGRTGTEIYLLGRSGRHVCVEDDVNNVLRYEYLKDWANRLEQDIIDRMNNLTVDDIH